MGKVPLFDWLSSGDVPLDESDVVIQGTGCSTCAIGCAGERLAQ
jgi:hypothetical protein